MTAQALDLPKRDVPEEFILCRGSFRAFKARQLLGDRHVRNGSTAAVEITCATDGLEAPSVVCLRTLRPAGFTAKRSWALI